MAENIAKVFCGALIANHPAADIVGANDLYGRLTGSWFAEVLDSEEDGSKRVSEGEWHFARVLEGRGIQDLLIVPARDKRHPRAPMRFNRYGSALRIFDMKSGTWRVHWCNPSDGDIHILEARSVADDIVEHGEGRNGAVLRWTFFDIQPDSFLARAEASATNGGAEAWRTIAEIRATREDPTDRMLADVTRS